MVVAVVFGAVGCYSCPRFGGCGLFWLEAVTFLRKFCCVGWVWLVVVVLFLGLILCFVRSWSTFKVLGLVCFFVFGV